MTEAEPAFVFTSRYGEDLPDPETMCDGDCDGIGCYPVWFETPDATSTFTVEGIYTLEELDLWMVEHRRGHGIVALARMLTHVRRECLWSDIRFAFREAFYCDGWHFIPCSRCNGTGRRS